MKALFLCLSLCILSSSLCAQDSLRTAYWEKYWERDYAGMDSVAVLHASAGFHPQDFYPIAMLAVSKVLVGEPEAGLHWAEQYLSSNDDNAWMLLVYAKHIALQDLNRPDEVFEHELYAEEELANRNPDILELYVFINTFARSYYERGDPLGALRQIDRVKNHPDFESSDRIRGRTLEKAGIISWSVGKYAEARAAIEEAIVIHRQYSPEPDFYLAQLTNNLGVICNAQGDLRKAVQLYEIAREYYLAFEGPDSHWVNVSYANMGKAYHDQGDLENAEAAFRKRQEVLESSRGTPFQRFENAHYTAVVLFEQEKDAQADSCLNRMESLLDEYFPEDGLRKAELYTLRARISLRNKRPKAAIASAQQSLASFAGLGVEEAPMLVRSHLVLSKAHELLSEIDSAYHYAELALAPYVKRSGEKPEIIRPGKECFEPLTRMASFLSKNRQLESAQELFELAMETLDDVRLNLDDAASRRFVYNQAKEVYFEYLHHLSRRGHYEPNLQDSSPEIIRTIERAKAFNLRLAQGQRRFRRQGQIPDSLTLRENSLLQSISQLREKQKSLKDFISLDEMRQELDSLRLYLRAAYPQAYAGEELTVGSSVQQIRQRLGEDEAYVTLLLGEDYHWVALVTEDQFAIKSGSSEGLQKQLNAYVQAFQNPQGMLAESDGLGYFQDLGYGIYERLFESFGLEAFEHVIFSPSANFGTLNPGLLITAEYAPDLRSVSYLMKHVRVSTRWSWGAENTGRPVPSRMGLFATSSEGDRTIQAAMDESQAILALTGGESFLKDSCTESVFRTAHKNYNLLHMATHGIIASEPWGTYLEFAPDSLNDGQLNLVEIAGLKLNAQHITLSACKSAQSLWQTGEAFGSLAIGFAEAGCPSLTASLWDAPDQSTREIMEVYYQGLVDGLPKSESLRRAQLSYLENQEDPLKTHPYFWGGFIQIGDDSPLDFDRRGLSPWWFLLLLPLAVYGIQNVRRRRSVKAA